MSSTAEFFFLASIFTPFALMAIALVNSYRRPKEEC